VEVVFWLPYSGEFDKVMDPVGIKSRKQDLIIDIDIRSDFKKCFDKKGKLFIKHFFHRNLL
jgi:hypothetical protein